MHGIEHDLDCLLGDLFCHLGAAGTQKPRRARAFRIRGLRGDDGGVETFE
jgi:hypothetical protein